jgi:hypothetical protein
MVTSKIIVIETSGVNPSHPFSQQTGQSIHGNLAARMKHHLTDAPGFRNLLQYQVARLEGKPLANFGTGKRASGWNSALETPMAQLVFTNRLAR